MPEKIIVIGAGIIGASIAYQLTLGGAEVTVLDQATPASGTTGNTFSWINANSAATAEYFKLRHAAVAEFRDIVGQLGVEDAARWGGSLTWHSDPAETTAEQAHLSGMGYEANFVDAAQFAALEPAFADPPERAIHTREEGGANAEAVVGALIAAAVARGATLMSGCAVTGFLRNGERVVGVQTAPGEMRADVVVCAAGPQAEALLAGADVRLPMANKAGIIIQSAPVKPVLNHVIWAHDIHIHQRNDGRLILGEIYSDGLPDPAELLARMRARFKGVEIVAERIMHGVRPIPVDKFPVVGVPHGAPGLFLASTHSGVTLGPMIGKLAAGEILRGEMSPLLSPYRPTRFN